MALPPDTGESFLREVDENLRRDQMAERARKYSGLVIGGLIVFLLAIGGYLFWQARQEKAAMAATEQYAEALQTAGTDPAAAKATFEELAKVKSDGVSASARLVQAALALESGDRKSASAIYTTMAADKDLAQPYRDIALIRGTALDYDSLKPDQVIERLKPLATPGNAFFGTAGEMTALALLAKGQPTQAGQLFAKIAADKDVPDTLRSRAVQIAGSLGVDASAALPGSPTLTTQ